MTTMKMVTCGVVLCALMGGVAGLAQGTSSTVKDDLFAGTEIFAKGASDVTEITMDPDTLGLVGGNKGPRAHSMVLNVVRTYEYDKPGMYNIEDVEKFRTKLMTGDWHCSVHTRSLKTGESTDVCNKRRTDDLDESAIITVEPKELTFIHTIRKRSAGEQGELGNMFMLRTLGGAGSLAMLDPEAFMDIEMAKSKMHVVPDGTMSFGPGPSGSMPKHFFRLQGPDAQGLQRQMNELQRQLGKLNDPQAQERLKEQMDGLQQQMKGLTEGNVEIDGSSAAPGGPQMMVVPDGAAKISVPAGSPVPSEPVAPAAPVVPQ